MRRFFLQSLFLHGFVLMLLFSWENPLAGKHSPRSVIEVSLIEKGEKETPSAELEKAAEKPRSEKKVEKPAAAPLPAPKEIRRETPAAAPRRDPPQREAAPQPAPEFQARGSEPPPPSRAAGPAPLAEAPAGEAAGRGEGEEISPGPPAKGGAGLMASLSLNAVPGIATAAGGGGGEKPARPPGEAGGNLGGNLAGPSPSAGDPVFSQILRRIEEAKRYPRAARRMGIEGTAVVRFKLKPGGQLEAAEIAESSGSDILDEASLKTVREAAPLPYKEGWLKVGIVFKIL
jgi:protein TonB